MANDINHRLADSPWWMRAMAYFGAPTAITLVLLWGLWQIWNTSMMTHASLLAAHNAESFQQRDVTNRMMEQHMAHVRQRYDQMLYYSQLLCERLNETHQTRPQLKPQSCVYPGKE